MAQDPSITIVKPRNDKREYKSLLLPNSLQVLLISDPDTDKAAASMNVSIGSFSDPGGLEGLAHFLEQDNLKTNVELELFVLTAKQPAFYQLRSVEQLGYIVVLMTRNDSGIRGAQFIIQSTVKDPAQLEIRVEAFLKMFESKLHAMSDDEIKEESRFYWREINDGTLKFDRKEVEVAVLRNLTKEDLIEFFSTYI